MVYASGNVSDVAGHNGQLLAHPDAGMEGAYVGLKGENLKK